MKAWVRIGVRVRHRVRVKVRIQNSPKWHRPNIVDRF